MVCSQKVQKWTAFSLFGTFFVIGLWLVLFWADVFNSYLRKQLILGPDTYQYEYWKETPFDINTEIYLFNWTNKDEVGDRNFKPHFQQLGPYVLAERHTRANVVFNDNKTVSFNSIRNWHFLPEKSSGSLDDVVTIMDPIVLAMANVAKDEHYIIRRALHYFLVEYKKTLDETKTAQVLLFDGIKDPIIDLSSRLKLKKFKIPYDKFGFFYNRNGSVYYDGNFTMWTGESDVQKTGIVTEWNGANHTKAYDGDCGDIDGTTGDVWYPVKDSSSISIFVPDVCSLLTLERQGSKSGNGIEGNLYVATDKLLDNGKKYPETACFSPREVLPSGVRDISSCQYDAPAFISLPHFYMADDSYRKAVTGMNPDPEKHKIELIIEPKYGLPVEASVAFQVNFKLNPVKEISLFDKLQEVMVPYLWIKVAIVIPDNYAFLIKAALSAAAIGQWIGYSLIFISLILFLFGVYLELQMRNIPVFGRFQKISFS
ncbi:protein croquemort-like [Coccinella septempunctata]|uniref:protein croquemort-like n=1 Tax=Coccinella septempunctata TaxID=41139 RepID=UPI001D06AA7D|nr:protein croquemort-like [Coccinella septempunctata]